MAAQPPNPSPPQGSQPPNQADGAAGSGSSDKLILESPQPMREDYVQNAVNFLSHPKVKGSPVIYRRSFLEKKGLTKEEIDEAFRRVPDPQPSTTDVGVAGSQQANNPNQSTGAQLYTSSQPLQPATGPMTAGPIVVSTQSKFSWYRTFIAAGLFLGFGASAAVFVKKWFLPKLKSWIRKVVAEGDETVDKQLKLKIDEDTAEAVKASTSAVSAIAKTNQELLASKDEEKKILVSLTQALDSQAKELKSLIESLNNRREDRFLQYRSLEEHGPSAPRIGPVNSPRRASQQTNMHGAPSSDFGSGRPSFGPVPTEPTSGSFSRSYVEQTMSAAQRGDRPSGSKSWEMTHQYSQQMPGFGSSSQLTDDGSNPEAQDGYSSPYRPNGKAPDVQVEDLRSSYYNMGADERPLQRRWAPPQAPGVAMPEAVAAIRQPKFIPKQPSGDAQAAEMQVNGAPNASDVATEAPINVNATIDPGRSEGETEEQSKAIVI